ncbi:MAG: alpha/beta fold hydrolase, partial [Terriglobales bacterium]
HSQSKLSLLLACSLAFTIGGKAIADAQADPTVPAANSSETAPTANSSAAVPAADSSQAGPPNPDNALIQKAEAFYQAEQFDKAVPLYEKLVAETTDNMQKIMAMRLLGDCILRESDCDKALAVFEDQAKLIPDADWKLQMMNLNDRAVCKAISGDYGGAQKLVTKAIGIVDSEKAADNWLHSKALAHRGYLLYMESKYADAANWLDQANALSDNVTDDSLRTLEYKQKIAFGAAGTHYHLKQFDAAAKYFNRMLDLDRTLFGNTDLQSGWARLALSDVYEKMGKATESKTMYAGAIYIFRKFNRDRIVAEYAKSHPRSDSKESSARITQYVFGKAQVPSGLDDTANPRLANAGQMVLNHEPTGLYVKPFTDAPGRVWLNPDVPMKGIVNCIHGLSLDHSAYASLGQALSDKGYVTIAFDMRGFGTYQQALGADSLDFKGCMDDLYSVFSAIRHDNPDTPVFVLGESMGGAIAVQFAALHPNLVDGLIASVPAGKRYKQKRQTLKVAVKFIENRHKAFDIGTDVINQATDDPHLRKEWADDPMTRCNMSPIELLHFQKLLNQNIESAKKVQVPTIIFQGFGDKLVKPQATYNLFQAITIKDKVLIVVGSAEHLIFEDDQFSPEIIHGLVGWLDEHSITKKTASERIRPYE